MLSGENSPPVRRALCCPHSVLCFGGAVSPAVNVPDTQKRLPGAGVGSRLRCAFSAQLRSLCLQPTKIAAIITSAVRCTKRADRATAEVLSRFSRPRLPQHNSEHFAKRPVARAFCVPGVIVPDRPSPDKSRTQHPLPLIVPRYAVERKLFL